RFAASWTVNFTWSMCSGERYLGAPRPGERFTTKMPLAASRSKSRTILSLTSLGSAPFQLANGWMAPYSCGGVLKFAATSRTDGTVTCCHGRCADSANGKSNSTSVLAGLLISIHLPPARLQPRLGPPMRRYGVKPDAPPLPD